MPSKKRIKLLKDLDDNGISYNKYTNTAELKKLLKNFTPPKDIRPEDLPESTATTTSTDDLAVEFIASKHKDAAKHDFTLDGDSKYLPQLLRNYADMLKLESEGMAQGNPLKEPVMNRSYRIRQKSYDTAQWQTAINTRIPLD